jgi:hypothetical protein
MEMDLFTDPDQVSNGYWSTDEGVLKKALTEGVRDIPGIRLYEEAITTFRQ